MIIWLRTLCLVTILSGLFLPRLMAFKHPTEEPLPNIDRRAELAAPKAAQLAARTVRANQRETARAKLRQALPGVEVEAEDAVGKPRRVASTRGFLTGKKGEGPSMPKQRLERWPKEDRHRVVKGFLDEHAGIFGHGSEALTQARVKRDYVTGHNAMKTVVWEQVLEGIPVFEGVLVAHLTKDDELVNVADQFMSTPGVAMAAVKARLGPGPLPVSARRAIRLAAKEIEEEVEEQAVSNVEAQAEGPQQRQKFKAGLLPGQAETQLVWLPMGDEEMRLCWQVELTRRRGGERYRVILDAETGEILLRHSRTFYVAEASYRVFTSDSPAPMSPGWPAPSTNQAAFVEREWVTWTALNTNASPIGWINDEDNETWGNNVDAHLDRNADDAPDLPRPRGEPFRVFDFPFDPQASPDTYQKAAVVQLFYWCNWMHDTLYDLGFTEAAGNFQKDNFGRGGLGNDPVLADAQDGSGVNNANFTPTRDGESPRIQMYIFDGPTPSRDGDFDAEIILHEYTHGLSDRLVGGGVGIFQLQTWGMGEGWSDFYATALLSEAGDPLDGNYAVGSYSTWQFFDLTENYYFGIRRYPYSTDLSINPLTFRDIDPGQAVAHEGVPINSRRPFDPLDAAEVHRQGEVWCVTLWEARANLIRKYGFATGNRLILQLVTDGMKLSPPNPNFLQARDAILQADLVASGGANHPDLWAAFAKRGMGISAAAPPSWTTSGVREAYDVPDPLAVVPATTVLFGGPSGGPISPLCRGYLLTNTTSEPISWVASAPPAWLTISPMSGLLVPGASENVAVCVHDLASSLSAGNYSSAVVFTNLTTGRVVRRPIQMLVTGLAGLPFLEDFEAGFLKPYWSITGSGSVFSQVTTNYESHEGTNHFILQAGLSGQPTRNELTLALDLNGYTNVVLRFWAKEFNEQPQGPPGEFVDSANFDGVAISQDGVRWFEAAGLRSLGEAYSDVVVDLDAAVRRFGLQYNSSFRIRFNQFGNRTVPEGGIALDDITITGEAPRRFLVHLPASARENDGLRAAAGRVSIPAGLAVAINVQLTSSAPALLQVPATVKIPAGMKEAIFDLLLVDDAVLDGTQPVQVMAAAAEFVGGVGTILIHDNESAVLTLSVPAMLREGDGVLAGAGRLRSDRAAAADIMVKLSSSQPGILQVPSMVVLPAGQTSVVFNVTVGDDGRIAGPQTVIIGAHVENWVDDFDAVTVADNEVTFLSLSLPALATEAAGQLLGAGLVRISGTLETNLIVTLDSSDPNQMTVPSIVLIPPGQTTATFSLNLVDDAGRDGIHAVVVGATAPGFSRSEAVIRVHDNEEPAVAYDPAPRHQATNVALTPLLTWRVGKSELVFNGGFELGNLAGWSRDNSGEGGFVTATGSYDPAGPEGPVAPRNGTYAALLEQNSPGTHVLFQDVSIPLQVETAVLNWSDLIRNQAPQFGSNHFFRVEVRSFNNEVLATAFSTKAGDPARSEWTERSFNLSAYKGQTIRIAFVEQDSLGFLNVALDDVRVMITFPDVTASEIYLSTTPAPGGSDLVAVTTNTSWLLPQLAQHRTYYWRVATRRGNERTLGPVWQFTTRGVGAVDHFEWSLVPSPQTYGAPFLATVTARDVLGQVVTNYGGRLNIQAERLLDAPPVRVLTFSGHADLVQEYRGSRGAISTYFTNYVETQTSSEDPATLRALLTEKDVFLIVEQENAPEGKMQELGVAWAAVLDQFVREGGLLVVCSFRRDEHLVLDEAGLLKLEKLGAEDTANLVTAGSSVLLEGVPASFVGQSVAKYAPIAETILRTQDGSAGVVITTTAGAGRVVMIGTDYFTIRTGLDRIIANAIKLPQAAVVLPVNVQPTASGYLINGAWSGLLTINDVASNVVLRVDDGAGQAARSKPFDVLGVNDLRVSLSAQPASLSVGGGISYVVTVHNSGPSAALGTVLDLEIPAGLLVTNVTSTQGSCAPATNGWRCQLGQLPAGEDARVTVGVRALASGKLTVVGRATQAGEEFYTSNNSGSATTKVALPSLYISDFVVQEGDSGETTATFVVSLYPASSQMVTCQYATMDFLAEEGQDYVPKAGQVIFPPGITNQLITVQTLGDRSNEGIETFAVALVSPHNAAVIDPRGVGFILDDDPAPILDVQDISVVEGAQTTTTNAVFELRLSAPGERIISVRYRVASESALSIVDYVATSGQVVFAPGQTNRQISVVVIGDDLSESNETFVVQFSDAVGLTLARPEARATIVNDDQDAVEHFVFDPLPEAQHFAIPFPVTISAQDGIGRVLTNFNQPVALTAFTHPSLVSVISGAGSWDYPMGSYYHDQRLQAIYLASELGNAPVRVTDLALFVGTRPGQTLRKWTVRVKHTSAAFYATPAWESEGWTTVFQTDLIISETGWLTFRFQTPFEFNGRDNLLVDFSFNNSSFSADGQCWFAPTTQPRSIVFRTDSGFGDPLQWQGSETPIPTAIKRVPAVRFGIETPIALTPAGSGNFTNGIWRGLVAVHEIGSEVFLRAREGGGSSGSSSNFAVRVFDDLDVKLKGPANAVGSAALVTLTATVTNSGPASSFGVRLTNAVPTHAIYVGAIPSQGSCALVGSAVVCDLGTIQARATATVEIRLTAPARGEMTNVVTVGRASVEEYLQNNMARNVTGVSPPSASIAGATVEEEDGGSKLMSFQVSLSHPSSTTGSVDFAMADRLASSGRDYVALTGTLFFPPGITNLAISVPILGDLIDETNETFAVRLHHPTNLTVGVSEALGVIIDNDVPPVLSLGDLTAVEGHSGITVGYFTANLSAPSERLLWVSYATTNGSATAGPDYEGKSGLLLFPPGLTSRIIPILITGDQIMEADETFEVNAATPVNVVIGRSKARGTIINDDGLVGQVDHFEWSPVVSPQAVGRPFVMRLTAKDSSQKTISNFNGTVSLIGRLGSNDIAIGTGDSPWRFPIGTGYEKSRTEVIYQPNEVGGARRVSGLALDLIRPPSQPLQNMVIRMKHTALRQFDTGIWETNGWTTVYQGSPVITGPGWFSFVFTQHFDYNGVDHLLVDFSIDGSYFTSDATCRSTVIPLSRSFAAQNDGGPSPTSWNGQEPLGASSRIIPNIRLLGGFTVPVTPGFLGQFIDGVWEGQVAVAQTVTNLVLKADDGDGKLGLSLPFDVLYVADSDQDGLDDEWERTHFGSIAAGPEADADGDKVTNLAEFRAGTNPRDAQSLFVLTALVINGNDVRLSLQTVPGRLYQVERVVNAGEGTWVPVGNPIMGTGNTAVVVDVGGVSAGGRFYRARLVP